MAGRMLNSSWCYFAPIVIVAKFEDHLFLVTCIVVTVLVVWRVGFGFRQAVGVRFPEWMAPENIIIVYCTR